MSLGAKTMNTDLHGQVTKQTQNYDKKIMGIYEYVLLYPYKIRMPAKLDTGADTSSIHGENIEIFEKEGKKWVAFDFKWDYSKYNEDVKMERPLVRMVKIKNKGGGHNRRPVVSLDFCLDGKRYLEEFTVANRDNFKYPLLLGREFLRKVALIDPDSDYLTSTNGCNSKKRSGISK